TKYSGTALGQTRSSTPSLSISGMQSRHRAESPNNLGSVGCDKSAKAITDTHRWFSACQRYGRYKTDSRNGLISLIDILRERPQHVGFAYQPTPIAYCLH